MRRAGHFHGISSAADSGVWAKASRSFFDGHSFSDLSAVDDHSVVAVDAIDGDVAE
jgi:hypothetical protein